MSDSTTAAIVADWLGISSRRVKDLRAEGVLPGIAGEKYDLRACVTAYCRHMRPTTGRAASGGSGAVETFDAARIRLLNEQADKLAMENERRRGELVEFGPAVKAFGQHLSTIRSRLLALPSEQAPALHRCKTAAEVQGRLTDVLHDLLSELSGPEKYVGGTGGHAEEGSQQSGDAP